MKIVVIVLLVLGGFGWLAESQHWGWSQGFYTDPVACPGAAPIGVDDARAAAPSDYEQIGGQKYLVGRSDCYRITWWWSDWALALKTHHAQVGVYKRVAP